MLPLHNFFLKLFSFTEKSLNLKPFVRGSEVAKQPHYHTTKTKALIDLKVCKVCFRLWAYAVPHSAQRAVKQEGHTNARENNLLCRNRTHGYTPDFQTATDFHRRLRDSTWTQGKPGARFSKAPKTFRTRKAICKNMNHLLYKAVF